MGLFTPFTQKGLELKNRIAMSSMVQFCAPPDGHMTEWHYIHYATRAVGGVGLIMVEASAIESRGRCFITDIGLWSDDFIPNLRRVVDFCHGQNAKIGIQLGHAGRKNLDGVSKLIAPSAIPMDANHPMPRAMTRADMDEVIENFRKATRRVKEAGFDVIELHGAHGYLLGQFFVPLSNQRTDEYGGSTENRTRFPLEVIKAVREEWPAHKPLWIRLSCTEYGPDGKPLDEVTAEITKVAHIMKAAGIDLIDCSTGGLTPVKPKDIFPAYQVSHSQRIRKVVGIPTATVGMINTAEVADEIIQNDRADIVMLGRELMRSPHWALEAARRLRVDVPWPPQYKVAKLM
jgi:NADPH2 dehydrogenase